MTGATQNYYTGLHEFYDMGFLLHFLRQEDRFLDIGANVGVYTVLAAGVTRCHALAAEPIKATFEKLRINLMLNGLEDRVQLLNSALSGTDSGEFRFIADRDAMNRIAPQNYHGRTETVQATSLNTLCQSFPATVWKMDVEGFEEEVLSGASDALTYPELQVCQIEGDSLEIRHTMKSHGFALCCYDPHSRLLTQDDAARLGANGLWVRDPTFVQERCRSGPLRHFGRFTL